MTKHENSGLAVSDEGDAKGLALGAKQGKAMQETVSHMADDVAQRGGKQSVADYVIAYAIEKAEGMYQPHDGGLQWEPPGETNAHLEIVVCDKDDGRFIPALDVRATFIDANGREIGTHDMPFLWHPYLYHYGRNWRLPADGEYTLRVHVAPARFGRHDRKNGRRYAQPAEVTFERVPVKTGRE